MGANKSATIVPGHGTVFVADVNTPMPAGGLADFNLTGPAPSGWTNIGHTSKDNTAAFSKSGGEPTTLDTWLADQVDTIYASTSWSLGVNALQFDEDNLNLAFGGFLDTDGGYVVPSSNPGLDKAIFLLATDGTGKLGFYIPNTSTALGDAPSIDTTKFTELPLSASILTADESVIPANADGTPGIMKIYKTGLVPNAPTIVALSQASGAEDTLVEVTGRDFAGATGAGGVKFGAINAGVGRYIVNSDTKISVMVPAGSGSQPITVTTPNGTSASKPFTIS
jgi:hypothetical protein